ncbi:hypothetical protein [Biformimicrobium ophioploci]|uniref:Uncharacterized protein n=1 Tax=Biformimicrobium ophioploci TaxID=3036711 RepID=A0ABQ6M0J0_9GAMM|nr:hypothetical protein [Microbulbifer sp. NKW57]GMG87826.1 hypothetical protein MNKW57_21470 [Microbulbifer sp. NKW57]
MKKFLIALGVLVALVGFLQVDDELDPGAQALLQQAQPQRESRAYLYLLGMDAPVGEDPEALGRERLAKIREAEARFEKAGQYELEPWNTSGQLPMPQLPRVCDIGSSKCLWKEEYLSPALEADISDNRLLLERYRAYVAFDDYRLMSRANPSAPLPSFAYLSYGSRLQVAEAISAIRSNELQMGSELLAAAYKELHEQLRQSDSLIHGMVMLALIGEVVDAVALISQEYPGFQMDALPELSEGDVPVSKWLGHELAHVESFGTLLKHHSEKISSTDWELPSWINFALIKPNMLLNQHFEVMKGLISDYESGDLDFKPGARRYWEPSMMDWVRNLGGVALSADMPEEALLEYVARSFDVRTKVSMANALLGSSDKKISRLIVKNSYTSEPESPEAFAENSNWYCLSGPLEDKNRYRCLPQLAGTP